MLARYSRRNEGTARVLTTDITSKRRYCKLKLISWGLSLLDPLNEPKLNVRTRHYLRCFNFQGFKELGQFLDTEKRKRLTKGKVDFPL